MAAANYSRYIHKVVDAMNLEFATESGWEYVEQIIEMIAVPVTDQVPVVVPTSGGGHYTQHVTASKTVTERRVAFLVRRNPESALAKLTEERDAARGSLSSLKYELEKQREQTEQWQNDHDVAIEARNRANERAGDNHLMVTNLRDQLRIMETDMAKVREAVGSVRMKEILGR